MMTAQAVNDSYNLANSDIFEKVRKLCYLGDMINADGRADSAVSKIQG